MKPMLAILKLSAWWLKKRRTKSFKPVGTIARFRQRMLSF